jgi:hypothetical protein
VHCSSPSGAGSPGPRVHQPGPHPNRRTPARIEQTEQANIPELRSFANGLRKDWDAVTAGLTMDWSSGAVEGNVNRIIMWNQICQGGESTLMSQRS